MPKPNELLPDGTLIVKCDAAVASLGLPIGKVADKDDKKDNEEEGVEGNG